MRDKKGMALVLHIFDRVLASIAFFLMLTSAIVGGIAVFMRYVLNFPLDWSDELTRYMALYACFLGAGLTLRMGRHTTIDILTDRLRTRMREKVELFNYLVCLAVCVVFVWSGIVYAQFTQFMGSYGETSLEIPRWMGALMLPIGLAGCAIFSIEKIFKLTASLLKKENTDADVLARGKEA